MSKEIERIDYLIIPKKVADNHWYKMMQYLPDKDVWIYDGFSYNTRDIQSYLDRGIIIAIRDTIINY